MQENDVCRFAGGIGNDEPRRPSPLFEVLSFMNYRKYHASFCVSIKALNVTLAYSVDRVSVDRAEWTFGPYKARRRLL